MIMYIQPQIWQTDILEFVQSSKDIDADSDDENEIYNAGPVPTSSEMRNFRKMAQQPKTVTISVLLTICTEVHEQMLQSGGQFDAKPPVFSSQSKPLLFSSVIATENQTRPRSEGKTFVGWGKSDFNSFQKEIGNRPIWPLASDLSYSAVYLQYFSLS
ncbi:hypothetical protein TNCV_2256781 [Trichonephila clavipes]|nr:hypothetical protein TNCV_2256781 [Trichonephila clavipes]